MTGEIGWEATGPTEGPGIVLVHSIGLDRSMWDPQVKELSQTMRVVTIDIRGHGQSAPSQVPVTLDELVDDVVAVADDAGFDRFHLCGLSVGGQVAMWAAITRPERLLSLVVANTAARIGTEETWSERVATVRAGGMSSISAMSLPRFFSPGFTLTELDVVASIKAVLESCDPDAYIACCEMLARNDLTEAVGSIEVRTLVIGGELDPSTPAEQAIWLNDNIADSDLVILEGAAHLSNLDHSEQFNQALREFLEA